MYEITVTETFRAAHQLREADGGLEALHEHDWRVWVTLAGPRLDAQDLLVDFVPLRRRLREILAAFTGCRLNDIPPFDVHNPSAERVAWFVAGVLAALVPSGVRLAWVQVEEEPGCTARYSPDTAHV